MMHRLFNILVAREEMQLELEREEMTSEKHQFCLHPMEKPFALKGIKMRERLSFKEH